MKQVLSSINPEGSNAKKAPCVVSGYTIFGLLKSSKLLLTEDFLKPKIVWARLMRLTRSDIEAFPRFCQVPSGIFTVDSLCFIVGDKLDHLISILNSEYAAYYFFNNVATLDNGGFQMRQQYIENIPIPPVSQVDKGPCEAFGFTIEEKWFISDYVRLRKEEILDAER